MQVAAVIVLAACFSSQPITTLPDMALCGGLRIRLYSRSFSGSCGYW